jgi:transcriptional regulator with XRE-family HTH domain
MATRRTSRRINTLPLRVALLERHISQSDLAIDLGYDPLYVSKVFRGTRPGQRFSRDVARYLGRPASELFGAADTEPVDF